MSYIEDWAGRVPADDDIYIYMKRANTAKKIRSMKKQDSINKINKARRILARRPEERLINDYSLIQSTLRKITTGLAYLSLGWSTVVLLGGFVTAVKLIDFWFLTAISAALAVNLPDLGEYKVASFNAAGRAYIKICDALPRGFSLTPTLRVVICLAIVFADACLVVPTMILMYLFLAFLLIVAPLGAVVLSLVRLVANRYGDAGGGDATNAAKLKASLQIFYYLALAQNAAYSLWGLCIFAEQFRVQAVARQCGLGDWDLVWRYTRETIAICATDGVVPAGRNLVTFAVGLLGSKSLHDRRSAVPMLHELIQNKTPVVEKLLASKAALENLMEALEMGDGSTRECAAMVVAAVAVDLQHIEQFPTALGHIASLLQVQQVPSQHRQTHGRQATPETTDQSPTTSMQAGRKWWMNGPAYWFMLYYIGLYTPERRETSSSNRKLLVSRGLLIIDRLALHQGNCEHICNNHVLLSKITAPLYSHAFPKVECSNEWTDILGRSLRIVARLISAAPGEASRGLRDEITSKSLPAVDNLRSILEHRKFGPVLKAAAIDVLAELASSSDRSVTTGLLGKDDINKFISQLWGMFLAENEMEGNSNTIEEDRQQEANRLRDSAGEALARILSITSSPDIIQVMFIPSSSEAAPASGLHSVVAKLTDMLISNKGCRSRAADILGCLCSHSDFVTLLSQDAIKLLSKVLQLIPCIPRETNDGNGTGASINHAAQNDVENPRAEQHTGKNKSSIDEQQQEEKEFLVALLSLAVVICNRVVDAQCSTRNAAALEDMGMVPLVAKLEGIIKASNDATVECLRMVKLSCQLVISLVQLKPSCIKVFSEHNFNDVLSEASKNMLDLDNCMLFDTNYNQVTKSDKPLASLVKQVQQRLCPTE